MPERRDSRDEHQADPAPPRPFASRLRADPGGPADPAEPPGPGSRAVGRAPTPTYPRKRSHQVGAAGRSGLPAAGVRPHSRTRTHHPLEGEDHMITARSGASGASGATGAHTPGAAR